MEIVQNGMLRLDREKLNVPFAYHNFMNANRSCKRKAQGVQYENRRRKILRTEISNSPTVAFMMKYYYYDKQLAEIDIAGMSNIEMSIYCAKPKYEIK